MLDLPIGAKVGRTEGEVNKAVGTGGLGYGETVTLVEQPISDKSNTTRRSGWIFFLMGFPHNKVKPHIEGGFD